MLSGSCRVRMQVQQLLNTLVEDTEIAEMELKVTQQLPFANNTSSNMTLWQQLPLGSLCNVHFGPDLQLLHDDRGMK